MTIPQGDKPAGSVTGFIRRIARETLEGEIKVPCGTCNRCCRAPDFYVDKLSLEEEKRLHTTVHPKLGIVLDKNGDGSCVYLIEGKCSIYSERPLGCRMFDCRMGSLTGILPSNDPEMIEAVGQWRFSYPTKDDRDTESALKFAVIKDDLANWKKYLPMVKSLRNAFDDLSKDEKDAFISYIEKRGIVSRT